jgi:class 3 adenylate cyclase
MERRGDALDVRVSDADRDHVVDQLKRHLADGRLTTEEFSDRAGEAYASRTARDLEWCLRELPEDRHAKTLEDKVRLREWRRSLITRFAVPNLTCIGVWALSGGGYFWPVWVLFGSGVVVTKRMLRGPRRKRPPELASTSENSSPTAARPLDATGPSGAGDDVRVLATCLFVDIVGSTELAATLGDARWTELLQQQHRQTTDAVKRWGGHAIFTRGDELVAGFDSASRAVFCARDIRAAADNLGLAVRAGLHAGEVQRTGADVSGIALHIGQRVSALANAGEILVSSTVKDLATGSGIDFEERGGSELKGVPGTWLLFAVAE